MARPNLTDLRRQQILDAFETCVARYGIEGATLAKTAEQAGIARALIRHNLGNRADLVEALTKRFIKKSQIGTELLVRSLPSTGQSRALVKILFDPTYSDPHLVKVANALIAASPNDETLAAKMRDWSNDFIMALMKVFSNEHANASPDKVMAVATGIAGIYSNVEALRPLGDISTLSNSSETAALLLIATLENKS